MGTSERGRGACETLLRRRCSGERMADYFLADGINNEEHFCTGFAHRAGKAEHSTVFKNEVGMRLASHQRLFSVAAQ